MKKIILQVIYTFIIRPLFSLFIGVKFENTNALSEQQQFIIIANHNSHLDALAIRAALPSYKLHTTYTVAALDYFGKTSFSSRLMQFFMNAVLIKRKRAKNEPSAIEALDEVIKEGKSLILFPEGSRGTPGVMADFKKGIAILLKRNPHVLFIPAYIDGFGRVLPKTSNLLLPLNCKVFFGDPMKTSSQEIDYLLDKARLAILNLRPSGGKDRNRFLKN